MNISKELFDTEGTDCIACYRDRPDILLIQPVDDHDLAGLDRQTEVLAELTDARFLLTAFRVDDWNRDLSPWTAPPVFGKEGFGDGAEKTLRFIRGKLIPSALHRCDLKDNTPIILGGYSLAGLFALWSVYQTDLFAASAAVSPSVWFPDWIEYAGNHQPLTKYIYLSLGNKEAKTKNQLMASVGDRIQAQYDLLHANHVTCDLEWNEGNHFRDPDIRSAKGFARCIEAL